MKVNKNWVSILQAVIISVSSNAELFEGKGKKDKVENMEISLKERITEVWCKTHKVYSILTTTKKLRHMWIRSVYCMSDHSKDRNNITLADMTQVSTCYKVNIRKLYWFVLLTMLPMGFILAHFIDPFSYYSSNRLLSGHAEITQTKLQFYFSFNPLLYVISTLKLWKTFDFQNMPLSIFSPWHLFYLPESPKADPFLQMDLINLSNSASKTKESNICTDGTRALHHLYK